MEKTKTMIMGRRGWLLIGCFIVLGSGLAAAYFTYELTGQRPRRAKATAEQRAKTSVPKDSVAHPVLARGLVIRGDKLYCAETNRARPEDTVFTAVEVPEEYENVYKCGEAWCGKRALKEWCLRHGRVRFGIIDTSNCHCKGCACFYKCVYYQYIKKGQKFTIMNRRLDRGIKWRVRYGPPEGWVRIGCDSGYWGAGDFMCLDDKIGFIWGVSGIDD